MPYGTLLCVSDKPLHGELKLPGMADAFYKQQVSQHLKIGIRTMERLRALGLDKLHCRKLAAASRKWRSSGTFGWENLFIILPPTAGGGGWMVVGGVVIKGGRGGRGEGGHYRSRESVQSIMRPRACAGGHRAIPLDRSGALRLPCSALTGRIRGVQCHSPWGLDNVYASHI